jgi:hypothetical protein
MGGAATALADDGSGPYYNPGGIAFARASSLSLSASIYGLLRGSEKDGIGLGHDFTYQDINTLPVSTSAVFKWGSLTEPDGAPVNALAVSVFVPDSLVIDDRKTANVQTAGTTGQQTEFRTISEQTIWAGVTYARRFGRLGIGVSGYVLIATSTNSLDITLVESPTAFAILSGRLDRTNVGVVGALGARYDVSDHLKLGLSVFTQEAGIYQDRRLFVRVAGSAPTILTVSQGGLRASPTLPWRIQLGGAWVAGPWTFAADAMMLPPLDVRDDTDRASEGFDQHIKRNLVVNGSVGAEYVVRGKYPVRAGFFTDFAASPSPHAYNGTTDDPNPNTENGEHVNRYGGSLSVGYRTEHTATDVGTIISYGLGKTTGFDPSNFSATPVHDMTNMLAYIFLASSYIF